MTNVVIVGTARTAIGTARKGSLFNTPPERLAATVLRAAIERSGVGFDQIDDVVMAESLSGGGAIARYAAVEAGLLNSGGMAVNRHCAGSLTAAGVAAGAIISGMERFVVAGGVNSSSMMPHMQQRNPYTGETEDWWMPPTHPDSPEAPNRDMSITVGWNAASTLGLTREEMDAWALRSHQRAIAAIDQGHFKEQIVPVMAIDAQGNEFVFEVDEHPRRDSTLEKLASLKPLHPEIEGFSITAGNASGTNDAAVAMVMTREDIAREEGLDVLAKILGWTSIGIDPKDTGLSVPKVVEKILARTSRRREDIALWEINEAFAAVPVAACRVMDIDEDTVNISGSGCSLGHPIGASGGRMIQTLAYDLKRRGGGLGIATMCAGGGQAGAVLIEV
ncbi:thiolase family protein [Novosphingobium malaysiense]|uniref:Acetyl-CoA acetyltransferase n=1 Tax=Novosphingobium malaysiense TaxID=1348853 RepID=A0A0B1ZIQ2_9SPHN|nr:thiolase family protein [Novosphingobium malaysiense]KHK90412.1 acetyl-CoA acetyltransferase [Novosphingobium malaysiense]